MQKVLGIGGVFIRAKNRESLARWYGKHLGIQIDESWWGGVFPLTTPEDTAGARVVWSAFEPDTDYLGSREQQFMLNFRVADCRAMLDQLRAAGCMVDDKVEESEFGVFGWVTDPEGHRVELWQPPE